MLHVVTQLVLLIIDFIGIYVANMGSEVDVQTVLWWAVILVVPAFSVSTFRNLRVALCRRERGNSALYVRTSLLGPRFAAVVCLQFVCLMYTAFVGSAMYMARK